LPRQQLPRTVFLWLCLLSFACGSLAGCSAVTGQKAAGADAAAAGPTTEKTLGVKVVGLRLTSAGYMLDFRYRVTEPEKSPPLFDRSVVPYLIHEESGRKFAVPAPAKVGPLRATTRKPEAGRIYFIFFANPGRFVKEGERMTVVVGDHRFKNLTVQ
jgi:hypothetical protein